MAAYVVYGFAQSGNSYKPALYRELAGADWASRIRAVPRWKHPYDLLPGHPIPVKAA